MFLSHRISWFSLQVGFAWQVNLSEKNFLRKSFVYLVLYFLNKINNNTHFIDNFASYQYIFSLKDTHREKAPSKRFRKVWIWTFEWLYEVLKLKQNFRKNTVVTSKILFFVIGPRCIPHFICLTLASDIVILYGNVAFSILVFSTKISTPVFWKGFPKGISKISSTVF